MQRALFLVVLVGLAPAGPAALADPAPPPADRAVYQPKYVDPVLKELEDRDQEAAKAREAETGKVRADQKAADEARKKARRTLQFDLSSVEKPPGRFPTAPRLRDPRRAIRAIIGRTPHRGSAGDAVPRRTR